MKVYEDNHLVSLQLNTSKPDVYVKLQILDHEEEIVSAVGKGHVVLSSFIFLKDFNASEDVEKRPSSRGCESVAWYRRKIYTEFSLATKPKMVKFTD